MPRKKPKSERAIKAARRKRLNAYYKARVIIAVAVVQAANLKVLAIRDRINYINPPSYYRIAAVLGLTRQDADVADEVYNDVNGPDDWTIECEERAMERVNDLIQMELDQ